MTPRKLYADTALHVRLTDEIQDLLTAEALNRNVTVSRIVREALEYYFTMRILEAKAENALPFTVEDLDCGEITA